MFNFCIRPRIKIDKNNLKIIMRENMQKGLELYKSDVERSGTKLFSRLESFRPDLSLYDTESRQMYSFFDIKDKKRLKGKVKVLDNEQKNSRSQVALYAYALWIKLEEKLKRNGIIGLLIDFDYIDVFFYRDIKGRFKYIHLRIENEKVSWIENGIEVGKNVKYSQEFTHLVDNEILQSRKLKDNHLIEILDFCMKFIQKFMKNKLNAKYF